MRIARFLRSAQIKLEIEARLPEETSDDGHPEKAKWRFKDAVLDEIVALLDASGNVPSRAKLLTDLRNRERKASTAVGAGIALPHVRTLQIREMTLAFARSTEGIDFDAPDHAPTHIFVAIVCPPYADDDYLKMLRRVADILSHGEIREELLTASSPHQVIRAIERAH